MTNIEANISFEAGKRCRLTLLSPHFTQNHVHYCSSTSPDKESPCPLKCVRAALCILSPLLTCSQSALIVPGSVTSSWPKSRLFHVIISVYLSAQVYLRIIFRLTLPAHSHSNKIIQFTYKILELLKECHNFSILSIFSANISVTLVDLSVVTILLPIIQVSTMVKFYYQGGQLKREIQKY